MNIGNALGWFDWNIYAIFAPFNELEELFTVPLASRSRGSGFTLTPTGEQVFELALSLLREADDLPGRATRPAHLTPPRRSTFPICTQNRDFGCK